MQDYVFEAKSHTGDKKIASHFATYTCSIQYHWTSCKLHFAHKYAVLEASDTLNLTQPLTKMEAVDHFMTLWDILKSTLTSS